MLKKFFHGRRWLGMVSVITVLALTGFLIGATTGHLPFRGNPHPTVKVVSRSEAAAGRGYSAVVKRVLPAVVNVSTSKVTKVGMPSMNGPALDPFFRQFFGEDFGQEIQHPKRTARAQPRIRSDR